MQVALSTPNSQVLLQDKAIPEVEANTFFKVLTERGPWTVRNNVLFGKKVPQPRLSFLMGHPYPYSGATNLETRDINETVREAVDQLCNMAENAVFEQFGVAQHFNSTLVQLYPTGSNYIGSHFDDEYDIGTNPVNVAILTLCDPTKPCRVLRFSQSKIGMPYMIAQRTEAVIKNLNHKVADVPLCNGQLVMMCGSPKELRHGIPQCKRPVGARISLSFRTF
jgi:hypothetical protein